MLGRIDLWRCCCLDSHCFVYNWKVFIAFRFGSECEEQGLLIESKKDQKDNPPMMQFSSVPAVTDIPEPL